MRSAFVRPVGGPERLMPTQPDGRFSITFPRPGGFHLWLGGVHHRTLLVPLLLERAGSRELEIRLAPVRVQARLDSVRVIGDFNSFSTSGAIPMHERPDGTFAATVDCKTDTLHYQLLGVQYGGGPLCGTQADTYHFDFRDRMLVGDRGGKFVSAVASGGRPVEVVFDPGRLPRSDAPPAVRFAGRNGDAAWVVEARAAEREIQKRWEAAYHAHRSTGQDAAGFRYDYSADLQAIRARIARERRPLRMQFLLLEYFHTAPADSDSMLARTALDDVAADSPLWSLEWGGPDNTFDRIARIARRPAAVREYADRVIESHPDSTIRAAFLYRALSSARAEGDEPRFARCYARLVDDYRDSHYAARARQRFGPDRAIQKGKPVPDVAFIGLDDSTVVYRPSDFRGRHLLIDFWAVWCGPCVAEMGHIDAAHRKYGDRGLAILSVSFDRKRADVAKFRAGKWKMPWLHAFAARGVEDEAVKAFEVTGIPRPVLVDPAGTIVALDADLRGAKLDETLARVLGLAPGEPSRNP